ncbi:hypothetical protein AQJ91_15010 [Streptomyces dysideae]|uniref:Uncharacterized protein n=1 Tax=Streptomyces dysideae TaxID=909626 RepID=A0A117S1G7_9ACTN|nr:hypothetical protein AQJ91_15010 [Streptomyces dysideae]
MIPAVGCALVLAVWLPSDSERYRDYLAAEPCPARATAQAWEDCLRTVPFTVESTKIKSGSNGGSYKATLSGAPFWNGTVAFGDWGPVLARLVPGDQVIGTVWRGDVMTVGIGEGGVRQSTSEEPRDEPQMTVAIGTFLGLLTLLGLQFGAMRLAAARSLGALGSHGHERVTWRGYGKPLLITMAVVCAGVGLPAVWLGGPTWVVPAVALPVVACTAGLLYRYRRPINARGRGA